MIKVIKHKLTGLLTVDASQTAKWFVKSKAHSVSAGLAVAPPPPPSTTTTAAAAASLTTRPSPAPHTTAANTKQKTNNIVVIVVVVIVVVIVVVVVVVVSKQNFPALIISKKKYIWCVYAYIFMKINSILFWIPAWLIADMGKEKTLNLYIKLRYDRLEIYYKTVVISIIYWIIGYVYFQI